MAFRAKWDAFFQVLDADHSGSITPADAHPLAKVLTNAYGIPEGSEKDKQLEAAFAGIIAALIKDADANKDGQVTKEEFTKAYESFVIGKVAQPDWFKTAIAVGFRAVDTNNNGDLSEDEYVSVAAKIIPGVPADTVRKAFQTGLKASNAKVDTDVFTAAVWKYFTSEEPTPDLDVLFSIFRPLK